MARQSGARPALAEDQGLFLAPILGSLQPLVTPDPEDKALSFI